MIKGRKRENVVLHTKGKMTFSKQYNGKIHQANKKGEQSEREAARGMSSRTKGERKERNIYRITISHRISQAISTTEIYAGL